MRTVWTRSHLWNKKKENIKSISQHKKEHVKIHLIESLLESVSVFFVFYLCVFFPSLLLSLLPPLARSDKRRQSAKPGCSGTNLSITADGTLTTCTLKIKLALKAGAWQQSLWKWLQRSATERGVWEKNKLRKQQWDGMEVERGSEKRERQRGKKKKKKVKSKIEYES